MRLSAYSAPKSLVSLAQARQAHATQTVGRARQRRGKRRRRQMEEEVDGGGGRWRRRQMEEEADGGGGREKGGRAGRQREGRQRREAEKESGASARPSPAGAVREGCTRCTGRARAHMGRAGSDEAR